MDSGNEEPTEDRFEKWLSSLKPNEKSTIEKILEAEYKAERRLKPSEILAMTPEHEKESTTFRDNEGNLRIKTYIMDAKGNIFDLDKHRIIYRNLKL